MCAKRGMIDCRADEIPAADEPILDGTFSIRYPAPYATHCERDCRHGSVLDGVCYPFACPPETAQQLSRCKCANMQTYSRGHGCTRCPGTSRAYYHSLYGTIRVCEDEQPDCGAVGRDFVSYGCKCGAQAFDVAAGACVAVDADEVYLPRHCAQNALLVVDGHLQCVNAVKNGAGTGLACTLLGVVLLIVLVAATAAAKLTKRHAKSC